MKNNVTSVLGFAVFFLAVTLGSASSAAQVQCTTGVCVTTWHNDNWRTSQNTNETTLTTTLVSDPTIFGKKCSVSLDDEIYGQPLVVTNVKFNQTTYPILAYVATEKNSVYAIDGTNCNVLPQGQAHLLLSGEAAADCHDLGNCNLAPKIGILSTPVVEITGTSPTTTGTLYAAAESESSGPVFHHRIWALDITNLSVVNSGNGVEICASGCGTIPFAKNHLQRPGLLFLPAAQTADNKKRVYVAFSMLDGAGNDPNGFLLSFDASTLTNLPLKYETTDDSSGGRRGGIWQGAAGPAAGVDSSTGSVNIFFSTGDGDFNVDGSGGKNAANSFVKLTTTLAIPGGSYSPTNYFTPSDQCYRYYKDLDYGSGGVMLLPDGTHPNYPYLALKGEKLNYLWVMDRANPGGFNAGGCTRQTDCSPTNGTVIGACAQNNWANGNTQVIKATAGLNETRHSPAFWSGNTSSFVKG